ncbi:MAG: hypothetical protein U9N73_11000 [Candidatus Auribacterota bacterium]|nr:hypothetical protein [Candidatus Auribacterota bacterium]
MFGFRLLAIILGFICLAAAVGLVFHTRPEMAEVDAFVIDKLIPQDSVQSFIKSGAPANMAVKNIIKYVFSGYAVFAIGMGLLFLYSAINPLGMRPFIRVVMIGSVLWIAGAVYQGFSLDIPKTWWIGDAVGAFILLVLLFALFPKDRKALAPTKSDELDADRMEE